MNPKKFMVASGVVFLIFIVLDFLIHGVILNGLYEQTASLWRPPEDIQRMSWIMWVTDAFMAVLFVWLFSKGLEADKPYPLQGVRFGFALGLLFSIPMGFGLYAILPIPFALAFGWFAGGLAEFVIAGLAAGLVCRPSQQAKP